MWSSFLIFLLENIKNEDFGSEMFEKGKILRTFSGLAPSKLKIFTKKNLMVAYVHIEYSTHQFSEESKGGWTPPPSPPVLAVPKKAWS